MSSFSKRSLPREIWIRQTDRLRLHYRSSSSLHRLAPRRVTHTSQKNQPKIFHSLGRPSPRRRARHLSISRNDLNLPLSHTRPRAAGINWSTCINSENILPFQHSACRRGRNALLAQDNMMWVSLSITPPHPPSPPPPHPTTTLPLDAVAKCT